MSNSPNVPAVFEKLAMNETTALSYSPDCSISYGRNLDRASCDNALAKISQVTASVTFGERGTGNWNVVLPRRYLSDNGQCAIDVKIDPKGVQRDVSNYLQITNAAGAVIRNCVGTRLPNTGGLVRQLGSL
ncbi:MAG: hypothetical protein Q9175_007610 [Cornicularia normoerica]